jgi:hypothetical protein
MAGRLIKINSSFTVSTLKDFDGTGGVDIMGAPFDGFFTSHGQDAIVFCDDNDNSVFVINVDPQSLWARSGYRRIVKLSNTGTIQAELNLANRVSPQWYGIDHRNILFFQGTRSFFLGLETPWNLGCINAIVQIDPSNLSIVQVINLPTNRIDISSVMVDPEGQLWAMSENTSGNVFDPALYVLGDADWQTNLDEKIFAYGMTAGLGRGWA